MTIYLYPLPPFVDTQITHTHTHGNPHTGTEWGEVRTQNKDGGFLQTTENPLIRNIAGTAWTWTSSFDHLKNKIF